MANLLTFNAISTLPTRNFSGRDVRRARRRSAPSEVADAAPGGAQLVRVVLDRLRAHLQGSGRQEGAAGVREPVRARTAVRGRRPRRGARGQRALRRARAGHDLDRRDDRLGDGVRRERPDRRAVAALRRRRRAAARDRARSARARGSATCSPRARGPPRASVGEGSEAFAAARQGAGAPRLRAAHAAGDGARPRGQRARRRPQPLGRLRGRPLRRRTTASTAASRTSRGAIETEDRAAIMDSLILCKFLRGVFADPYAEWAQLLSAVTGWDVDADELAATARRIVLAKRLFNLREGWTRAEDWLPERFLSESLELESGRKATLTAERLDAMISSYYRGTRPRAERACRSPRPSSELDARRLGRPWTNRFKKGRLRLRWRQLLQPLRPRSPRTSALTIDGREVTVPEGTTILEAAAQLGIEIPVLCHDERYDPVGVCRMCVVDVGAPRATRRRACARARRAWRSRPTPRRVERHRAMLTELLLADQPDPERRPEGDDDRRQRAARARAPATASAGRRRCPQARGPRHRRLQPRDRRRSPGLHPLRPLHPRLRRDPVQRRHRPHRQGLHDADRVRPRRADGRVHVRLLRRVRGRLPDRRADQQADPRRPDPAARRSCARSTPSARTAASAAR